MKPRRKLTAAQYEQLGSMTQNLLHNFNNALASINGFAEFLMEDLEKGSQSHLFAENIHKSGEHLKKLIEQVRTITGAPQNGQHEDVDLCESLETLLLELSENLPQTLHVHMDYACELDDAYVKGSKPLLDIALANILENAVDALGEKGGKISISLSKADKNYNLTINDTGEGMSGETLAQCHNPFFSSREGSDHHGLGLNVAESIIQSIQGSVAIESQSGQGTSVTISLPQA